MRKLPSAFARTGTSGGALAARTLLVGVAGLPCARMTMTALPTSSPTTRTGVMILFMSRMSVQAGIREAVPASLPMREGSVQTPLRRTRRTLGDRFDEDQLRFVHRHAKPRTIVRPH